MQSSVASRGSKNPIALTLPQALLAFLGGLVLFVFAVLATVTGYNIAYGGKIYPGVAVAGVDLTGLRPQEAATLLSERLSYPQNGRLVFQEGEQVWLATPAEVGLFLDSQNSALTAYQYGRGSNPLARLGEQFKAWYRGVELAPIYVYDQRIAQRFVNQIAAEINRPTIEAGLKINGTEVVVLPGQVGRTVDSAATLAPLEAQLRSMTDGLIPVVVRESPPVILDASEQAEIARQILSAPLTLTVPEAAEGDPGPWEFDRQTLADWLTIERLEDEQGARYQVGLDREQLFTFLQNLAPEFARQPANARFIFNDDTRELEVIEPAVIGRALNVESSIDTIPLVIDYTPPQVGDDVTAADLGISELVSVQTSYFYGSSSARIQNIQTAAARFHGLLVPPGATFSMAEILGDVSLDNGYAEALIIFGNRTIKGAATRLLNVILTHTASPITS